MDEPRSVWDGPSSELAPSAEFDLASWQWHPLSLQRFRYLAQVQDQVMASVQN